MCLAARRPRRTRKVIARSASFSISLLLVSSSIVLDEDRLAQRDRCASAAAPPLLRFAVPLSPSAPLARPFSGCLSTPHLRSSCVCIWPAAAWPLGGLPSAVCGCSNATDGGTADRARASWLAPCTRRPRSGRKTACCLVLADAIFFFAHSGSENNNPVVHGAGVVWQRYGSVRSVLCQFYVSSMSVPCQFYGSSMAALGHFYVSSMSVVMPHAPPPSVCALLLLGCCLRIARAARLAIIAALGIFRASYLGLLLDAASSFSSTATRTCFSSHHTARERARPIPRDARGLFMSIVGNNSRLGRRRSIIR